MQILNVVDEPAGEKVLDLIDDHSRANVDQLDVCVILFAVINRFVGSFVVADASAEVVSSSLGIETLVIRRCGLDLADVVHNEILVVAHGLDEQRFDARVTAGFMDPLTALSGGVGGIEDGNHPFSILEPVEHVLHGSLGSGPPHFLPLCIVRVEEFRRRLRGTLSTAVAAYVENASRYTDPSEIA